MTQAQLKKEFTEKWKKENPQKYTVWLICYFADLIPIVIAAVQLMGGLNDKKIGTIFVCFAIAAVLGIITLILSSEQKKDWKKYLEENKNRLK